MKSSTVYRIRETVNALSTDAEATQKTVTEIEDAIQKDAEYNGYSNYETWLMSLNLDNEQPLNAEVMRIANGTGDTYDKAQELKDWIEFYISDAVQLATACHAEFGTDPLSELRLFRVPAHGTSTYCATCSTKLRAVPGTYDLQACPTCHVQLNRHANAAQNVAIRGQDPWLRFRASLGAAP